MSTKPEDIQVGVETTIDTLAKSMPTAAYMPMQPLGSVQASTLTSDGGVRRVRDRAGNVRCAKGVKINLTTIGDFDNTVATTTDAPPSSATAVPTGVLCVHLVGDFDSIGAKQYTFFQLAAGDREGFCFDEILDTGTTILLAEVKVLL